MTNSISPAAGPSPVWPYLKAFFVVGVPPPIFAFILHECELSPPGITWQKSVGIAFITALVVGTLMAVRLRPTRRRYWYFKKRMLISALLLTVFVVVYALLHHKYVVLIPRHAGPEVIGTELQPEAEIFEGDYRKKKGHYPSALELLRNFGNSVDKAYMKDSVSFMEICLFGCWIAAVISLSYFFAVAGGFHTCWRFHNPRSKEA